MKKNLIPLLGIAFVVAIAATGLFYGLVSSQLSAGTEAAAAAKSAELANQAPVKPPVPPGLRAVSVQVADSSGVLVELKPGNKVDVQAIVTKSNNDAELRTILENITVLRVSEKPESAPGRPTLPVVTMLVTPEQSDVLALADTAARIRLALRNPDDAKQSPRPAVSLSAVITPPRVAPVR